MMNMHIHIRDGIDNIEKFQKFVDNGKANGIDYFVFLEHGNRISPNHKGYLVSHDAIDKRKKSINLIKEKNKDVEIYNGIEIDYSFDTSFRNETNNILEYGKFDFVIGGVHGYKYDDRKTYFEYIIDMIINYDIDIVAHIKLYDDWKEYEDYLEKIAIECSKKNVMIEINSSTRSIWNEEQLEYMLKLMKKYSINYTIGSDAHHLEELMENYQILKKRLLKLGEKI